MKCLNCQTVILKKGLQRKHGSFCLEPGEPKKIEGEGSKSFVRCPKCQAKNYLESWPLSKGGGQYYFSNYECD